MNLPFIHTQKRRATRLILRHPTISSGDKLGIYLDVEADTMYDDFSREPFLHGQVFLSKYLLEEANRRIGLFIQVEKPTQDNFRPEWTKPRPKKCVNGHRQISENVIHWPNGKEDCRVCYMKWKTKKLAKQRAS
jgi:hypothetical protein